MIVGFAGAGNMAGAIARGWAAAPDPPQMLFCDLDPDRAQSLAERTGGATAGSLTELVRSAPGLLLLGVKPNALDSVAEEIGDFQGTVVSILGATSLERLAGAFPSAEIIRVMPNMAAAIGAGVICHARVESSSEGVRAALDLLSRSGTLVAMEEEHLDAATAMSGCSPAFWARAAAGVARAGVEAGLDPAAAMRLAAESMVGTGRLLETSDPADLARAVASPGGSTEAGLEVLDAAGVEEIFERAARASIDRMRP